MKEQDSLTGSEFVPVEKSPLFVSQDKRTSALERCESYTQAIEDYLEAREHIPSGLRMVEQYAQGKKRVLDALGGTEENWSDWRWHVRNTITDIEVLAKIVEL